MDEPSFSINDFRKWLYHKAKITEDAQREKRALCRLGLSHLEEQIKKYNPTLDNLHLAKEFKANGAKVITEDTSLYTLEISTQQFKLPKVYTKLA